jgi:hypothetical protein
VCTLLSHVHVLFFISDSHSLRSAGDIEEFSPWEIEPVDEHEDSQRESQLGALLPKLEGVASCDRKVENCVSVSVFSYLGPTRMSVADILLRFFNLVADNDLARARALLSELMVAPEFARFVGDPTEALSKIVVPMSLTRIAQRLDSTLPLSSLSSSSSSASMHAADAGFESAAGSEGRVEDGGHTVPYYRSLQSVMRDISQVCIAFINRRVIPHFCDLYRNEPTRLAL